MSALLSALDRAAARARMSADLAVLWLLTLILQPMVSPTLPFADDDMLAWALGTVAVATIARGRRLGPGPHPQLRPRRTTLDGRLRRLAAALTPLVLLPWYRFGQALGRGELADIVAGLQSRELTALAGLGWVGGGVAGALLVGFLVWLSRDHLRTAWRPLSTPTVRTLVVGVAVFWLGAVLAGAVHGLAIGDPSVAQRSIARWMPEAAVVGLAFLSAGLVFGRPSSHAQRQAAGRRDGRDVPLMEREFLFALLGPSTTLYVTLQVVELLTGQLVGYESAFVVSLHGVAWAGVVWTRRVPRAVDVLLHEVAPAGGKEVTPGEAAEGFDTPPEGALRIDPLDTRPTRSIHPWRVPVTRSRISDLDDPIRSLWRDRRPPPAHHLLGEARFEPDASGAPQWSEITVHMGAGRDVTVIQDQDVQTRRMVVLRPFPRGTADRAAPLRTYRWEHALPAGSIQVVDAATRTLSLRDGDLIVVSSEGVARAYRVEIGSPVGDDDAPVLMRLPQLQDYSSL
jgi:hypothetical protein